MIRAQRISEIETDISLQKEVIAQAVAKLQGFEAELSALKSGLTLEGKLSNLKRTDAILSVLRSANGDLSPTEVLHRLNAAGRTDDRTIVTSTLAYLLKQELIRKPSRARYLAL